jgi:sialic acid synthase
VSFYEERGRGKDLVLYACTSGYPVAFQDICVLEINRLQEHYGDRVKSIGFSGHHLGIAADVAAMTAGIIGRNIYGKGDFEWVERHFTLDRTWKGTDHAASLEPDGMRRLCRDLKNVRLAVAFKDTEMLDVELVQRKKLKWTQEKHGGQIRQAS